jgi:hypothetical protein
MGKDTRITGYAVYRVYPVDNVKNRPSSGLYGGLSTGFVSQVTGAFYRILAYPYKQGYSLIPQKRCFYRGNCQ